MTRDTTQAYPLSWPDGWPRTHPLRRKFSLAGGHRQTLRWNAVVARLRDELDRLGARGVVLSTMQPIRQDGEPYAARITIDDPGAAVYFALDNKQLVMAQDLYERLIDNIRSLALAVEGLRQMDRHGGAHMMERAFAGFKALPDPGGLTPAMDRSAAAEFLGKHAGCGAIPILYKSVTIRECYRAAAKKLHPDVGGSEHDFKLLQEAVRVLGGDA